MLLKLPLDILINIASYLSIYGKLQLVLTCKRFKEAILDRCLYETLDIPFNKKEETESIILKFRKNRSKGHQVKKLSIDLDHLSNQLYREIPLIFPNVVNFNNFFEEHDSRPEEASSEFIKWKDTLEYLYGATGKKTGVVPKLLENNVFARLTTLNLRDCGDGHPAFLQYIKNTPSLERLCLEFYIITIETIESIHSVCPLLSTFTLCRGAIFISKEETLPKKITPALHLSDFALIETAIHDRHCIFLDYFTRKYTKLILLRLELHHSEGDARLFFPNQSYEEIESNPDYVARSLALDSTYEKYGTSMTKKLSNLSSTLRSLQIYHFNLRDVPAIFSKRCVNLTRIDFVRDLAFGDFVLASPEDFKMLARFPNLKYINTNIDPSVQKYEQVPALTIVTHLDVSVIGESSLDDMDIGWILSVFPSLKSLDITSSGVRLTAYESDLSQVQSRLTNLSIEVCATYSNLLRSLRNIAPDIKELKWVHKKQNGDRRSNERITENGKKCYTIDLSGFSLDSFHLEMDRNDGELFYLKYLLEIKDKRNSSSIFAISNSPQRAYYVGSMIEYVKENINTIFTVHCGSTKTIIINSKISINVEESTIQQKYR